MRKTVLAGAAVGATMLGAAVVYYFRERATPGPDYRVLRAPATLKYAPTQQSSLRRRWCAGRASRH